MLDGPQEEKLVNETAILHSVSPELLNELLALAPKFENFNIYGVKAEFSRVVAEILDRSTSDKKNSLNP
jgi:hypothetical protein